MEIGYDHSLTFDDRDEMMSWLEAVLGRPFMLVEPKDDITRVIPADTIAHIRKHPDLEPLRVPTRKLKQWCTFELEPRPAGGRVTDVWRVIGSGGSDDVIGTVRWHGPWRKYVYIADYAILSTSCMAQIAEFVDARNAEHAEAVAERRAR